MATFNNVVGPQAPCSSQLQKLNPKPPHIAAAMLKCDIGAGHMPDTLVGSFDYVLPLLEQTTPIDEEIADLLRNHLETLTRTNWKRVQEGMKQLEERLAKGISVELISLNGEIDWPKMRGGAPMVITLVGDNKVTTMYTVAKGKPIEL